MIVVLDTNALHGDMYATGRWIETLFEAAEQQPELEVWTPSVVVDELVRQFPERLEEIEKAFKKYRHDLRAFGWTLPDLPADLDAEAVNYRQQLEARLTGEGRLVAPQPGTVSTAVEWVAQRRKPIKEDGTGVVDAVIWLTVIEAAKAGTDVVLISNNSDDFADGDDKHKIHDVLQSDLDGIGINPNRVTLRHRVLDFNVVYIEPAKEATEAAEAFLADAEQAAALEQEILDAVEWFPLETDTGLRLGAEVDDATLTGFHINKLELRRAGPVGHDFYMTLVVSGEAELDIGLRKSEAYSLPDDSPISIWDWDWNESMAQGTAVVEADLLVDVLNDGGDLSVSIDDIDVTAPEPSGQP